MYVDFSLCSSRCCRISCGTAKPWLASSCSTSTFVEYAFVPFVFFEHRVLQLLEQDVRRAAAAS